MPADIGTEAGGFRVLGHADGNVRIAAWGYWSAEVVSAFGIEAPAAVQTLDPSSIFVLDCKELKPQGAEGQEALRRLFRALASLSFAKGMILRGNAMTCMQLTRLLRECEIDGRIEFTGPQAFGS